MTTTVSSEDSNSSVVDSEKVRTTTVRGTELVGYILVECSDEEAL